MRVLIIPAAGQGRRFSSVGYAVPKPLIRLSTGDLMVTAAVRPFLNHVDKVIILASHALDEANMALLAQGIEELGETCGKVRCTEIQGSLIIPQPEGAALTVLSMQGKIPDDAEVVVANSDQIIAAEYAGSWLTSVGATKPDGSMLTFNVPDPHDCRWSFVVRTDGGQVSGVLEKEHVSDEATCGVYYFKTWALLRTAIVDMLAERDKTNGEYYLAPAFNYIPEGNLSAFKIPTEAFASLGTPELLSAWEASNERASRS